MVTIKNNRTGVESKLTAEQWAKVQKDAYYNGVFSEVKRVEKPDEVKELEAKKAKADNEAPKPKEAKK